VVPWPCNVGELGTAAPVRGHHSARTETDVHHGNTLLLQAVLNAVVPSAGQLLGSCKHVLLLLQAWRLEHRGLGCCTASYHCVLTEAGTHRFHLGLHATCRTGAADTFLTVRLIAVDSCWATKYPLKQ
jgi:hypothetical protein